MNGSNLVLDTNILIYHLQQNDKSISKLLLDNEVSISAISKIELLGWHKITNDEIEIFNKFLEVIKVHNITPLVISVATNLRRKYKLKTPDSIIAATAILNNIPLVTNDSDFSKIDNLKIFKYN